MRKQIKIIGTTSKIEAEKKVNDFLKKILPNNIDILCNTTLDDDCITLYYTYTIIYMENV